MRSCTSDRFRAICNCSISSLLSTRLEELRRERRERREARDSVLAMLMSECDSATECHEATERAGEGVTPRRDADLEAVRCRCGAFTPHGLGVRTPTGRTASGWSRKLPSQWPGVEAAVTSSGATSGRRREALLCRLAVRNSGPSGTVSGCIECCEAPLDTARRERSDWDQLPTSEASSASSEKGALEEQTLTHALCDGVAVPRLKLNSLGTVTGRGRRSPGALSG
mmetsp:Transcript_19392/g.41294  ORF Transcript_19392/g.41294 Transcript_19392/m.41294 type:complete len:226 (-) Transcript_19392:451-1128(-)